MNKSIRFLAAAGLIGGGCWVTSVWGQQKTTPASPAEYPALADLRTGATYPAPPGQPGEEPYTVPAPPPAGVALPNDRDARPIRYRGDSLGPQSPFGPPDIGFGRGPRRKGGEALKEAQFFHAAVEKLRSAKEGAEKETAKKELLQLLEKSFTRDLDHREQEVAEIESRIKRLREQIERRKKAKDEIVGLRLKTIVNETEGLGFPGSQSDEPLDISRKSTTPAARFDVDFERRTAPVPDGR